MLNMKMTTSIWRGLAILVVMFLFSVPGLARSQVGKESLKVFSSSANANKMSSFAASVARPVRPAPLASLPTSSCTLSGSTWTCELWAKTGWLSLPGSINVPVWGFSSSAAGAAQLPGPALIVDEGDTVDVILHNTLSQNVSLIFPGQSIVPDYLGVASSGTKTYSFVASRPGTYLYQSGVNVSVQVPMGLYGALIVRSATGGQAYDDPATAFDEEYLLVLSEIDVSLHTNPSGFNMANYDPDYWLINGKAYPATDLILADPGDDILLRFVNSGLQQHTMSLLGLRQRVIAMDGYLLEFPLDLVSQTIPSGQTADMIVSIPPSATAGTRFPLYSRSLYVTNGPSFPGGMLTFIEVVGAPPPPPTATPTATLVPTATFTPTVTLIPTNTPTATTAPTATSTVTPTATLPPGSILLYLSLTNNSSTPIGSVNGVRDEDILSFNGSDFAMIFDGSDVGTGNLDLDAFMIFDSDTILMSFNNAAWIPGVGAVDDSDILRFEATSLGANTTGTFSMFFDASLVGLDTDNEDVDALELLSDGRLIISTVGVANVPGIGITLQDEDLIAFTPAVSGDYSNGSWAVYFDGSDVGLAESGGEDVIGASVAENGDIYLTTVNTFSVSGISGENEDVFVCTSPTTGMNTSCLYSPALYFDGSLWGLSGNSLDGIDLP